MLEKKIILLEQMDLNNSSDALRRLGRVMLNENLVKDSYIPALIEREKEFPTGLEMNGIGIAIPHTDAEHVIEAQIGVMTLKKPVTFNFMGDDSKEVDVKAIFMLALKSPDDQIGVLQKIVGLLQKEEIMNEIISSSDEEKVLQLIKDEGIY